MKKWMESEKFPGQIELIIAILMGLTAVLTAYASWQSALYGGSQAEKYTQGTAAIADANQLYNEASQLVTQDMDIWTRLTDLQIDIALAEENGDSVESEKAQYKYDKLVYDSVGESFQTAIDWAEAQEDYASPFEMEGYLDSYYTDASEQYAQGQALIEAGSSDNELGDRQGLVTVIFSVALFMLGIASTFKQPRTQLFLAIVSIGALGYATAMMLSVPMLGI